MSRFLIIEARFYDHLNDMLIAGARGVMALTMDGVAIGNGILTVENEAQALVRADPAQKNKGGEAAVAAMALLALRQKYT